MRRRLCVAIVLALGAALTPVASGAAGVGRAPVDLAPSGGLIVTLDHRSDRVPRLLTDALRLAGVATVAQQAIGGNAVALRFAQPTSVSAMSAVIELVENLPGVTAVEPDRWVSLDAVPDDKYFPRQTNLWQRSAAIRAGGGDYSIGVTSLWGATTGSPDVVVAVVDSGLVGHPEFKGQRVRGYDFISDPAIARDGDGRDPRPSDPGAWSEGTPCAAHPSAWHGTHVAGIIAARRDNAIGISGIAPGVKLQPVRVVGRCFGLESDVLAGIRWAAGVDVPGVPTNARPADVINLSLSAPVADHACPAAFQSAIDDAVAQGAIVVASAGNQHTSVTNRTPANCDGVVSVGAVDRNGNPTPYTNAGRTLDFMAPGGVSGDGVWSTVDRGAKGPRGPSYARYAGTSMAAPAVSGAVALVLSLGVDGSEVLDVLRQSAKAPPADGGCFPTDAAGVRRDICGAGVLQLSDIPVPSRKASIVGSPVVGDSLRVQGGRWNGQPASLSVQWLRDGRPIDGANDQVRVVTEADLGHRLSVRTTSHTPGYPDFSSRSKGMEVPKARSKPSLRLSASTTRRKTREMATIEVAARQGQSASGWVRVLVDGKRVARVALDGEPVRVRLPTLKSVGQHWVRVYFAGNTTVAGDWSKRRWIRVVK